MRIAAPVLCAAAALVCVLPRPTSAEAVRSGPIPIAVFPFELDDATPAAAYTGKPTTRDESVERATEAACEQLAGSGRYRIVSVAGVDARPVREHMLRDCDGCDADIARRLGARQSMTGVIRRATQTDYYVMLIIRDARTGKIINAQDANFAGGEEGWASGVRMLIKHQVLAQ